MKFLTNLDLNKNQVLNALLHLLSSAPSSPTEGQVYQNTTDHHPYYHNGTTFKDFTDALTLGGQNSAFHLARANHTGTQTASTISDFDTQVRTNSLNQMTAPTADLSINSHKLTSVTDPTNPQDAATKNYVDGLASGGVAWKNSVRVATAAAGTLASSFENGDAVDGVVLSTGDRILIKDQASGSENGIYIVAASGAPTRAADADSAAEIRQAAVWIEEGTANADSAWVCTTNAPITLGSTALTFVQFSGLGQVTAGNGLTKTANTLNVGQGTGITVNADDVAVDTALIPRMFTSTVGNGSSTSFTITAATHGVGSGRKKSVQIYDDSTGEQVFADVTLASNGDVTIAFATAPTSNQYRVNILGIV